MMDYKVITVVEFVDGVKSGKITLDIFSDYKNVEKVFPFHVWDEHLSSATGMMNGMLEGRWRYLIGSEEVRNGFKVDYNESVRLQIFFDAIKPDRKDDENIRDIYYGFDSSGGGFMSNAYNMMGDGGIFSGIKNKINCKCMLDGVLMSDEFKKAGKRAVKKYSEAFEKIREYPLCFAVMDKKRKVINKHG